MMYGVAYTTTPAGVKAGKFKYTDWGSFAPGIHKEEYDWSEGPDNLFEVFHVRIKIYNIIV